MILRANVLEGPERPSERLSKAVWLGTVNRDTYDEIASAEALGSVSRARAGLGELSRDKPVDLTKHSHDLTNFTGRKG